MTQRPGMLARGPWRPDQVEVHWREDAYEPGAETERAADAAISVLRERGSPAHDGMATRLADWSDEGGSSYSPRAGRCDCSRTRRAA